MTEPRVTFGIIVLNGEPFVRYNLRALYPFAHEIIVVEGAVRSAAHLATADGHSTDGTLETLRRFRREEDPENKLVIVARDGFWSEKSEQSQAYAERATGSYLWQVDIDEFYHPQDMRFVIEMLGAEPGITAVSFKQVSFWGGWDIVVDGWYLRQGAEIYHRLFKWGPGYRYVEHRPPTVHDPDGRDLLSLRWLSGHDLARKGILMYHYSLLFPQQVRDKCGYYNVAPWVGRRGTAQAWAEDAFFQLRKPFRVHNVHWYPSWLERFEGSHPPEIEALRIDIAAGNLSVELRNNDDAEDLLRSRRYQLGRAALKALEPVANIGLAARRRLRVRVPLSSRRSTR